jgi:predicted dehydrogenase
MIKFGIIGLGKIAHKFAHDINLTPGAILQSVGSRNLDKAKAFAITYQAHNFYDSYEKVAADKEVDIIYIATPHVFHFNNTMMCLNAGKAVICEKPFAMNQEQVSLMIHTAKSKKLFLMEAFWTRFIPGTLKVIELIEQQIIGDIYSINANFGYVATTNPSSRLISPALGGGALLDIGIYPVFISTLLLGKPVEIKSMGQLTTTGIDQQCAMLMKFESGAIAALEATFMSQTSNTATIYGSKGKIIMHAPFHHTSLITIALNDQEAYSITTPLLGNGYTYEIMEVIDCMTVGKLESDKMNHQTSLDLMVTLDNIRALIGLTYDAVDNN